MRPLGSERRRARPVAREPGREIDLPGGGQSRCAMIARGVFDGVYREIVVNERLVSTEACERELDLLGRPATASA